MGIKDLGHINKVKAKLITVFEMIDIGSISFYFGLKIERDYQKQSLKLF